MKNKFLRWIAFAVVTLCIAGYFGIFYRNEIYSFFGKFFKDPTSPISNPANSKKIVPHSNGSIYTGFTENTSGDISNFEQSVGKKVALTQLWPNVSTGSEKLGKLDFSVARAETAWQNGYITIVSAYEATPFESGFTVDRLIKGEFDADLKRFADKMKQFGKPMYFSTAREPNGALSFSQGGFGQDGDLKMAQAKKQNNFKNAFDPSNYPTNHLSDKNIFTDIASPEVCDGIERLAAAQRYYYDFFVNREGIDFLTFDSMGWSVRGDLKDAANTLPGGCGDFSIFLKLVKDYSDWISINWYLTPPEMGEGVRPPEPANISDYGILLGNAMEKIRKIAPNKPVLITELGFCQKNKDGKAVFGLNEMMTKYPEIKAFFHWGSYPIDNSDCGINPSEGAQGFQQVFKQYPDKFSSCVEFGDGTEVPNCSTTPTSGVLHDGVRNSHPTNSTKLPSQTLNQCIEACVVSQGLTERQCKPICESNN